jgi:hypothetical protein
MKSSMVIAAAPWVSAVGSWLLVGAFCTSGTVSSLLCALALATLSVSLGALLTHFPR